MLPWRNMYVTIDHGCVSNSIGTNTSGCATCGAVIWTKYIAMFANNSRLTHGVIVGRPRSWRSH